MLTSLGFLAAGLAALFLGGEMLVRGAASLGRHVGLSPLVSGLTIVAFGTSAPELAVSLQAAMSGIAGLAVGNVVGSNICNIALILGMTALIRPPRVEAKLIRLDVPIMIACSIVLAVLLLDAQISRIEGAALTIGLAIYIAYTIIAARDASRRVEREFAEALPAAPCSPPVSALLLVVGLGALIFGSDLFVDGAAGLAESFGVPPAIVGLSIVAIGTSLPEIATTVVAAIRGHPDMAVGNIVGSNIFNLLGILGITSLVHPVAQGAVTGIDIGVMIVVAMLVLPLMFTGARINRWEGTLMLGIYAAYLARLAIITA